MPLLLSADFSKVNFLEKKFQQHYQSVKLLHLKSLKDILNIAYIFHNYSL